jgi:hypothetical protein
VGGGIDSYYEYLWKCGRLFGDAGCELMWKESRRALDDHLADEAPSGLWYGQVDMDTGARTASEFGALHAFLPALLAVGGDLPRARRLQQSCFKMWTLHGIEPELLDYRAMRVTQAGYPLRPGDHGIGLHPLPDDEGPTLPRDGPRLLRRAPPALPGRVGLHGSEGRRDRREKGT